jgi:hypothetical protein
MMHHSDRCRFGTAKDAYIDVSLSPFLLLFPNPKDLSKLPAFPFSILYLSHHIPTPLFPLALFVFVLPSL